MYAIDAKRSTPDLTKDTLRILLFNLQLCSPLPKVRLRQCIELTARISLSLR